MSSSEDKLESVETDTSLPNDLNQFLQECERDFGSRYTEDDEEFAALMHEDSHSPPIVCPWYCRPPNYSRGRGGGYRNYDKQNQYDHRNNYSSRNHSNERSGHDSYRRSEYHRRDHEDRRHDNRHRPY